MVTAKFKQKSIKNCQRGWGCGNSCISKKKGCRIVVGKKSKSLLEKLAGGGLDMEESIGITDLISKKIWSEQDSLDAARYLQSKPPSKSVIDEMVKIEQVNPTNMFKAAAAAQADKKYK